jgi:hypothetical protein
VALPLFDLSGSDAIRSQVQMLQLRYGVRAAGLVRFASRLETRAVRKARVDRDGEVDRKNEEANRLLGVRVGRGDEYLMGLLYR